MLTVVVITLFRQSFLPLSLSHLCLVRVGCVPLSYSPSLPRVSQISPAIQVSTHCCAKTPEKIIRLLLFAVASTFDICAARWWCTVLWYGGGNSHEERRRRRKIKLSWGCWWSVGCDNGVWIEFNCRRWLRPIRTRCEQVSKGKEKALNTFLFHFSLF